MSPQKIRIIAITIGLTVVIIGLVAGRIWVPLLIPCGGIFAFITFLYAMTDS